MIRRTNENRIDTIRHGIHHLPVIGKRRGSRNLSFGFREVVSVDIAKGHYVHIRCALGHCDSLAPIANADLSDLQPSVGRMLTLDLIAL